VIDAGHGYKNGKPDGAKGLNNLHEDEIALAICNKIKALNKDANLKLVFTRPTEEFVDLRERLRISTEQNADLFISIHAAAAPAITVQGKKKENPAHGAEIYVARDGTPNLAQSKELGLTLLSEMKTVMHINEPGLKQRQLGIYVIQSNPVPSVLIECGFLSSSKDVAFISNEKNQEQIAKAILKGIVNYANGKKIAIQETTTSPLRLNDTVPVNQNKIFTKTEVDAKFKGNWALFVKDYLNKYKETLENDPKSKNEGCLLEFIVHEDGSISQIKVLSNTESKLANISIELLKNSPKWEPAIQNGKAVNKLVKTTVLYFDEEAWARYKERNKETGGTDKGIAKLTDKYGMFILDGKKISKEEMRTFLNNNPSMNNWKFNLMDGGGGINRYGEKGKNGVMEVTTKELKPTVAVAAENVNILFAKVENPLKVAVSDVPLSSIDVKVSQGKVERRGDRFIVSNLKPGELTVTVSYYYQSKDLKTEEIKYKVINNSQEITLKTN
jgi:N-acetylmuramoyl-L-alanine amidase